MAIETKLYVTKKFGNDLVGIRTSRGTLTYNKPACVGSINN